MGIFEGAEWLWFNHARYDSANHVVSISRSSGGVNDPCQALSYTYGTDPTVYAYQRLISTSTGTISQVCTPGMWPTSYNETYTYNAAGAVATKGIGFARNWTDSDGDTWTTGSGGLYPMTYTYDEWGHVTDLRYPGSDPFRSSPWYPGVLHFVYTFDSMGRPSGMTDSDTYSTPPAWVQNVTYDYAGRRTSMQYPEFSASSVTYMTEAKTYNVNGQMTELSWTQGASNSAAPSNSIQYTYSLTQNNGQITQAVDAVSGETIAYAYDALKRLTSASSTPISGSTPAAWTQTFQYDGFGNLTAKVLNGSTTSIPVSTAGTNQLAYSSYDANGNMLTGVGGTLTYDEANRMASFTPTSGGTEYYGYAPDNKRVYRFDSGNDLWTMYGAYGEKLGTLTWYLNCTDDYNGDCNYMPTMATTSVWFAGKLLWSGTATGSGPVFGDRLGTNRVNGARYRPYGDEITSTANGYEKFATYTRDSFSTLDYADQRYYASLYGRFNTPDPSMDNVDYQNPLTWNAYTYANGDPVNANDPTGLDGT